MPKHPSRSTYAKTIGEIAIRWNDLERELNNIAFHYMSEDSTVAGFILANMGNQVKADFATLLVKRFELNATVKDHALHAISLLNRLRENRNIVEHAVPHVSPDERYMGKLYKLDKNSNFKAFEAPIELLREVSESMKSVRHYVRRIRTTTYMMRNDNGERHNGGPTMAEAMAHALAFLGKPPLPRKISPLELEEAPAGDPRPPPPSRA